MSAPRIWMHPARRNEVARSSPAIDNFCGAVPCLGDVDFPARQVKVSVVVAIGQVPLQTDIPDFSKLLMILP